MLRIALVALALCGPILVPSALRAQCGALGCPLTIDDFTQGALPLANGPFEFTFVGLPEQSCYGGWRKHTVADVPGHQGGMVSLGGGDIGFQVLTEMSGPDNNVVTGADASLTYEMPDPVDLTQGGRNDRLVLNVVSVDQMSVFTRISHPGGSVASSLLLEPGSNVYLFSSFPDPSIFEQVEKIEVFFNEYDFTGVSEVTLRNIKVQGSGGRYLQFELPRLIEYGPPYPLPGPLMEAIYVNEAGVTVPTERIQVSLFSAIQLPVSPFGAEAFRVEMFSEDSEPGRAPGASAGFSFVEGFVEESASKAVTQSGRFQLSFDLQFYQSSYPTIPNFPSGVVQSSRDVFHLPFEVPLMDETGLPIGSAAHQLRVQVPDGVGYDIRNVSLLSDIPGVPSTFFLVEFELEVEEGAEARAKDQGQPLFEVSLDGSFYPEFRSTAAPVGAGNALGVVARPSVTSDRTQLSLSRPLDHSVDVQVYDVAGRRVRQLHLPAGRQSLAWDTRDDRGRELASGLYFLRVKGPGAEATGKVLVVR